MILQGKFRLLLVGISALLGTPAARADLIVSVRSVVVNAGSLGNGLNVQLSNTGPSAVLIEAFSFGISTMTSGIDFTEANISTPAPYIFAGNSTFGPEITVASGQTLTASDLDLSFTGASLASGAAVGLAHLLFDVTPGATPGEIPVTLLAFPATSLADAQGNNIPIQQLSPGDITIEGTVVPEPSFLPVLVAAIALVLIRGGKPRVRAT